MAEIHTRIRDSYQDGRITGLDGPCFGQVDVRVRSTSVLSRVVELPGSCKSRVIWRERLSGNAVTIHLKDDIRKERKTLDRIGNGVQTGSRQTNQKCFSTIHLKLTQ